jgi:hypothetical protein
MLKCSPMTWELLGLLGRATNCRSRPGRGTRGRWARSGASTARPLVRVVLPFRSIRESVNQCQLGGVRVEPTEVVPHGARAPFAASPGEAGGARSNALVGPRHASHLHVGRGRSMSMPQTPARSKPRAGPSGPHD